MRIHMFVFFNHLTNLDRSKEKIALEQESPKFQLL